MDLNYDPNAPRKPRPIASSPFWQASPSVPGLRIGGCWAHADRACYGTCNVVWCAASGGGSGKPTQLFRSDA